MAQPRLMKAFSTGLPALAVRYRDYAVSASESYLTRALRSPRCSCFAFFTGAPTAWQQRGEHWASGSSSTSSRTPALPQLNGQHPGACEYLTLTQGPGTPFSPLPARMQSAPGKVDSAVSKGKPWSTRASSPAPSFLQFLVSVKGTWVTPYVCQKLEGHCTTHSTFPPIYFQCSRKFKTFL